MIGAAELVQAFRAEEARARRRAYLLAFLTGCSIGLVGVFVLSLMFK